MLSEFFGLQCGRERVVSVTALVGSVVRHVVQGDLVLLSDSHTDGSFLLHHFLTQALKGRSGAPCAVSLLY